MVPALANDICPELIDLYSDPSRPTSKVKIELLKLAEVWDFISESHQTWQEIAFTLEQSGTSATTATDLIQKHLTKRMAKLGSEFFNEFSRRLTRDLPTKLRRVEKIQIERKRELPPDEFAKNVEGSIRAAFYMAVRRRYNERRIAEVLDDTRVADFFFLREYCYASMFRFNSRGEFNVPYGGISYNRKRFQDKIERLYSSETAKRLLNTKFYNLDFEDFIHKVKPTQQDFVFVDPPYDSDFTDYDDKEFREIDQRRLAKVLSELNSNVMLIIGDTELVRNLYPKPKWKIQEDQMSYKWTIKDRNERSKVHLTITNYKE